MFSISEVAEQTGLSAYTLRYYEKINLLPEPSRLTSGKRYYTEANIKFISFLKSLKETGMTLEDIQEFVKDGCIWDQVSRDDQNQLSISLEKRMEILSRHLEAMEKKKKELEDIIELTKDKIQIYHSLMDRKEEL